MINLLEKLKNEKKGITIISLVVTIIVMLILAGTSIEILIGEKGIITQANRAAHEIEIATIQETLQLLVEEKNIYDYSNGEKSDPMAFLRSKGVINEKNVINVEALLGKKSKYAENDGDTSVYKINGNKLIYINKKGEKEAERNLQIKLASFVTKWKFEAGDTIVLPIAIGHEGDNNFVIDWGDNSPEETINDKEVILEARPTHTYSNAGTYEISITGKCSYFTFDQSDFSSTQASKLISVVSWGAIEARCIMFEDAINLEEIAEPYEETFKYFTDDAFDNMFASCEKLKSIPNGFLDDIPETINSFEATFYECASLTSIPENLFDKAVNATNFCRTFYKCNNIERIPENLFDKTTKVTSFSETFYRCTSLTSIPENLFDKAVNATNFYKTFYRCNNIERIPEKLFDYNVNVTNFQGTFYDLRLIESAPKLWERTTSGLDGTGCFGSCDKLIDLIEAGLTDTIPAPWTNSID